MSYTFAQFKSRVNAKIKGKIGILTDYRQTLNDVARQVVTEIDLRSTKRKTALTPNLFTKIFEYACPTDLKALKIINVVGQTDAKQTEYELTTLEEFMRRQDPNMIAISDNDLVRKILVNAKVNDKSIAVSSLDSLIAGGGTWVAFGDAENLDADNDNYVRGNGSISWDISSAGGTTAGIQNTGLNQVDLTEYLGGNGALFVWAHITSTTNLTNYILRIGNDSGNYYSKTITTQSDGTAFVNGWNLLRFDLTSLSETGSVTDTTCDYVAIYMTKTSGKVSETDYRFDDIVIKKGVNQNVLYYSKYPWRTAAGVYIANSTVDSDILNVDEDEYNLMVEKATDMAGNEVDEYDSADRAAKNYANMKKMYQLENPSEAKIITTTYADFIEM